MSTGGKHIDYGESKAHEDIGILSREKRTVLGKLRIFIGKQGRLFFFGGKIL